jgi:PKD repeat protein
VAESNYITVNPKTPPVAAFAATPTSGKVPLTVTFTDQSTNTPTSWSWSFGDGGTSTLQNPTYVYAAAGTYTVTLTATNGDGSNALAKQAYVTVNPKTPPVANFTADVTSGNAPLTVNFTDLSTNTPTSWSWQFGDGGTSTLQNPTYVYNAAGTYTVTLTVTNADGSNTLAMPAYINATLDCGNSQSLLTTDGQTLGCVAVSNDDTNLYVTFTGTASDPLVRADWAWGYSPGNIPQTGGLPDPTKFPNTYTFPAGTLSYAFPGVDISQAVSSDTAYIVISAHALTSSGEDLWVSSSDEGPRLFDYDLS